MGGDAGQAVLHVRVGDGAQLLRGRPRRGRGRQAGLGVVAVLGQVLADQRLEQFVRVGGEHALVAQDAAERLGLVQRPGVHGGDQLVAAHEVELQGQDAEEQVAVGRR